MLARSFLDPILRDDALTRCLGDPEARLLIEWLVDEAERLEGLPDDAMSAAVAALCKRGRVMARFVSLWSIDGQTAAATQLAACEGLADALPAGRVGPRRLMRHLIAHESARRAS